MVDADTTSLSISIQCKLLSINRSSWYYKPIGESELNLSLMRLIDEQFLATPYYGSRQMVPLAELPMATSENYFAGQVILVGYGRVGKRIANLLFEKNIPYVWSQMKIEG